MSWQEVPGWYSWQGVYRRWAKEAREGAIFVECGVFLGRSLGSLLEELRGKEATVYAVDPHVDDWQPGGDDWTAPAAMRLRELSTWGGNHKAASDAKGPPFTSYLWHATSCIGADFERVRVLRIGSVEAARIFDDGTVDYVWIDANHNYEPVVADIAAWTKKIRPGGAIGGHDYTPEYPGVQRAVREAFGDVPGCPEDGGSWEVRR